MAAIADAYTHTDPVQDGYPSQLFVTSVENFCEDEDLISLFGEADEVDDLDSLFGGIRGERFVNDLTSERDHIELLSAAPGPNNIGSERLGLNSEARQLEVSNAKTRTQEIAQVELRRQTSLTLPSTPPRRYPLLSLPKTPPVLVERQHMTPTVSLAHPQVTGDGHGLQAANSIQLSNAATSLVPQPESMVLHWAEPINKMIVFNSQEHQDCSFSSGPTSSNGIDASLSQSAFELTGHFDRSASPGSSISSFPSVYAASNTRTTPDLILSTPYPTLNSSIITPRGWHTEIEGPPRKKSKGMEDGGKCRSSSQPSDETLREFVQLGSCEYQSMIEEVKLFMLDMNHPERYKDAVLRKTRLKPAEQKRHDAKLQQHATNLLDGGFGQRWWGAQSVGFAQKSLKWPHNRVDLMFTLPQILVRVCRKHEYHLKQSQARPRLARTKNEAEVIARDFIEKAMLKRDLKEFQSDDIECHITFVLAHDNDLVVRPKIIALAGRYPRYMDLVNFLVSLVQDSCHLTGFSVCGPLGYVKINHQGDWETIIDLLKTTPKMASIALCMAEVVPIGFSKPPRSTKHKPEVISLD